MIHVRSQIITTRDEYSWIFKLFLKCLKMHDKKIRFEEKG